MKEEEVRGEEGGGDEGGRKRMWGERRKEREGEGVT